MSSEPKHERYYAVNRGWWDAVVPIHEASRGYDREGFLRGEKLLCPVEIAELGPRVPGKTLLHYSRIGCGAFPRLSGSFCR
jgi:hypothetical protein